ncbi:MAG: hypothetical protein ACYDIE_08330 [Candidatus Krumholzibacteriia bacterium]
MTLPSPAACPACPACGAPLPTTVGGARVRCGWCGADTQLGAPPATRRLLLADEGDAAEASALLRQHLAVRFRAPATVRGDGQTRWAPFWSVLTADGDLFAGPATREENALLRRVTVPALPARPLAETEAPPTAGYPQDLPLDVFLATLPAAASGPARALERAWLVWVPLRLWQVRIGTRGTRAVTVADLTVPVLGPLPESEPTARLRAGALAPLVAFAACLVLLGRLLPLALHVPAAALLFALALWAWRGPAAWPAGATAARSATPADRGRQP